MEEQQSPREELAVKVRKPYTITKQREKWTEEEHNSFLEALKLYGRAWQRIEDHIGTKTAVQIRSHAQKFFTKMEKEALSKGASPGHVHDIDIPPPRPKRKPNYPYPRKTTTGSLSPSGEAAAAGSKPPNPICFKNDANKEKLQVKEISEGGNSSVVLNIAQRGLSASASASNKGSTSPILMEFLPTVRNSKENAAVDNLVLPVNGINKTTLVYQENVLIQGSCTSSNINIGEVNASKSYHHVPSSKQACTVGMNRSKEKNGQTLTSSDQPGPAAAVSPSMGPKHSPLLQFQHNLALGLQHQFSPVVQYNNQHGSHETFLNMSSAFSSLIISTLQQIPPVHAAASLAASYSPPIEADGHLYLNPEIPGGDASARGTKPSPSTPALVTATIAAAAAWWAAQGFMPWSTPHLPPVFPSPPTTEVPPPTAETMQVLPPLAVEMTQVPAGHQSEILKPPKSSPKPVSSSSSPSDESAKGENSKFSELNQAKANRLQCMLASEHDLKTKNQDEFCGMGKNTIPDELEIDEDKKTKHFIGEASDRSNGVMGQSWMPISEQNHIAVGAFFERRPYDIALHTGVAQTKGEAPTKVNDNNTEASSSNNFKHGNFKASQSVFKPYKRCSVEAKENKTTREETGNKRICLPEEA